MNKSPGAEEKFKEISAAYEVSSALWYLLNS
jgi:DnaJ-class molecular chaperone